MSQPGILSPSFCEDLLKAQALSQYRIDVVIGAGLAYRGDRLLHREPEPVRRGGADVITLQRGGAGQHNIGSAGCCGPPGLVDDDSVRFAPRLQELVYVLLLVECVPTAPVHQVDVGIGQLLTVKFEVRARVHQHVGDSCHRYKRIDWVTACRQPGRGHSHFRATSITGAIAVSEAASR